MLDWDGLIQYYTNHYYSREAMNVCLWFHIETEKKYFSTLLAYYKLKLKTQTTLFIPKETNEDFKVPYYFRKNRTILR